MGVNNRASINDLIQWSWNYCTISFNGVSFVDTYAYYANGSYDASTGTYTGGTLVGYIYVKYDDVDKNNIVNFFAKKV